MAYIGCLIIFDLMNANGGLGATHVIHRLPRLPPLFNDLISAMLVGGIRVEALGHWMLMFFIPKSRHLHRGMEAVRRGLFPGF